MDTFQEQVTGQPWKLVWAHYGRHKCKHKGGQMTSPSEWPDVYNLVQSLSEDWHGVHGNWFPREFQEIVRGPELKNLNLMAQNIVTKYKVFLWCNPKKDCESRI